MAKAEQQNGADSGEYPEIGLEYVLHWVFGC